MSSQPWYLCTLIALFVSFGLANCKKSGKNLVAYPTITVDQSGRGNFSTIQSAIDSIPLDNRHWICIYVKTGVYREKVTIPSNKPFIYLKGGGKRNTYIVWDDHDTVLQSPTFTVLADNFIAKSISFTNSYNYPWMRNGNPRAPAVAAMVAGDKSSFYRCGFYGVQDTLWDVQGRHYFKLCTIVGAVDFIFGTGQSIYEACAISVIGGVLEEGLPGYITAQGRTNPNDANGFVFKGCNVFGTGSTYLGRAWRDYARVLFYDTNMTNIIEPKGWDAWNVAGREHQITFAEHDCNGLGSKTLHRVGWESKLSWATVKQLTSMTFIDAEGWIRNQPFQMGQA
ncbi:hypothetical protein L1049_017659 [Liquidambar formosana]|uniref:Pectinesterase n=1 Tax=Liquidambar formosana TaxID=63359 RepID=A0AAP0S1K5_LIQFO